MKSVLVWVLVVVPLVLALPHEDLFTQWTKLHGKTYRNDVELAQRRQIFIDNLKFVTEHNAAADRGEHTFRLGMNRFADLTNAEYRQQFLGLKRRSAVPPSVRPSMPVSELEVAAAPAAWDWRKNGYTVPVKDQGQCGSCWAFSATAAMEASHFVATGTLLSLSEQLCVDCVLNGADTCDIGGEMHDCYLQVIQEGGDELESAYPYTATSGNTCKFQKSLAVATFSSYSNVTQFDENALMVAASQTVVSVAIDASSIWFQLYSSGVFNDKTCKTGWNDLDHGVAVVGYDVTSSGQAYWIVRNSWGESWGQAGYIWMSRNANNQCGIATDATVVHV